MISKDMYLLAKKIVDHYESNQMVMPKGFPSVKKRNIEMKKLIQEWRYGKLNSYDYRKGFTACYNWMKKELKKQ